MSAIDAFLRVLEDPAHSEPIALDGDRLGDALRYVFVHVACSDGVVQESEFTVLERLLPGKTPGEVLEWVADIASLPFDLQEVTRVVPDESERRKVVEFAVRVAWADHDLAARELALLSRITVDLDLHESVLDETIARIVGSGGPVEPERVSSAVGSMSWKVVADAELALPADLSEVVPASERLVTRLIVDGVPQVALFHGGFAARFHEGPAFIRWDAIRHYTRVPTLGSSVSINDHTGRSYSISEPRLREVADLLDRLYRP